MGEIGEGGSKEGNSEIPQDSPSSSEKAVNVPLVPDWEKSRKTLWGTKPPLYSQRVQELLKKGKDSFLPPYQRAFLEDRYRDGLSVKEIAEKRGVQVSTVVQGLSRAVKGMVHLANDSND